MCSRFFQTLLALARVAAQVSVLLTRRLVTLRSIQTPSFLGDCYDRLDFKPWVVDLWLARARRPQVNQKSTNFGLTYG